jgi:nucleotide-binding universal stress UspA family protein
MNRIVLGVDREYHHEPALRLLARLHPEGAAVDVFHVGEIPLLFSDMTLPSAMDLMADALEEEKRSGHKVCEEAAEQLRESGFTVRVPPVVGGYPAAEIMDYADRIDARLIAVGGTRKGVLRSLFLGSVGRALVIGAHQNVLIAKGAPTESGPVRAVFATDHSAYADRCLEELLTLAPRGISHLTVVTCYPKEFVHAIRPMLPEFVVDPSDWIETNLRERNERVVYALKPLGCEISSRVYCDTATSSIPKAMKETGADLLILGAQGHGFIERLKLGSTSFHQVIAEPYPVLVLRVPVTPKETPKKA